MLKDKWQEPPYSWVLTMARCVALNDSVTIDDVLNAWALDGCILSNLSRGLRIEDQEDRRVYFQAAADLQYWLQTGTSPQSKIGTLDDVPF